ncbi:MAG: glycosyltransferase [Rhodospirillales bacterium 20-60-12]|nr:MAG: glycosyltransferase [Rhodospirillales bacterium 20-60-12]
MAFKGINLGELLAVHKQKYLDLVSIIVPIFNEERALPILISKIIETLDQTTLKFEIIAVDDGSSDRSFDVLTKIAAFETRLKAVPMMAGLDNSVGTIIVPIDADLQNDPMDIPRLLDKLNEGFDVVSGWRRNRNDSPIRRNFLSRRANWIISKLSGVALHDYGCSLKAYRRSVITHVKLYGEMHRFIPIYASWYGARITEIEVKHHPRAFGKSNYGTIRILKVILDLIVVCFLDRWIGKPIYVFGGFGILWLLVSALTLGDVLYLKFFKHLSMILTPLPLLVAMSFMMGIMSILIGLLAEIAVRVYFESQSKKIYYVKEIAAQSIQNIDIDWS